MADVKISELTALASASADVAGDVLAIVDTSVPQTKKITVENLLDPVKLNKATDVIGIGDAPNTWNSLHKGVQFGYGCVAMRNNNNTLYLAQNSYYESSGSANPTYIHENDASELLLSDGSLIFRNAASGTGTITWGEKFRISSDGKVGINTANPIRALSVSYGVAKTETNVAYAMSIQSNESSGQAALQVYAVGGASAAARKWQLQTTEVGVANAGEIELQPDGGKVTSKGIYFTGNSLDGNDTGIASSGDGGDLRFYTNGTNSWKISSTGHLNSNVSGQEINCTASDGIISLGNDSGSAILNSFLILIIHLFGICLHHLFGLDSKADQMLVLLLLCLYTLLL